MLNEAAQTASTLQTVALHKAVGAFIPATGKRPFVTPQLVKQGRVAAITGASDFGGGCDPETETCEFTP